MKKSDESRARFVIRSAVVLAAIGLALLIGQLLLREALQESRRTNHLMTLAARQSDLCARLRPDSRWTPAREQSYLELQRTRDEWSELAHEPWWALSDWLKELRFWRRGLPSARAMHAWQTYSDELAHRQSQLSLQAGIQLQNVQEMQRSWMLSVVLILLLQAIFVLRPSTRSEKKVERPATQVRLMANLEAAARVQRSLLPSQSPAVPGLSFAWQYHPCEKVAGDMYGIQVLDERHVACYVLDVSGHGMPAALLSVSLSRTLSDVEGLLRRGPDVAPPSFVVSELNRRFPVMSQCDQFITMCYGVLDLESRTFTFVRAGHPGPLVLRSPGLWMPEDEESCPPVGILDDTEYRNEVLFLEPGDRVLLYTDGITEAVNLHGEMFGLDRLLESLQDHRQNDLQTSLNALLGRIERFSSRTPLRDDLTVLGFELALPATEATQTTVRASRAPVSPRDLAWCARTA